MVQEKAKAARYWEIDALRGVAILLMISYHLTWDLSYFGVVEHNVAAGFWGWYARSIGTTFIWIVGVSLVLSYARSGHTRGFWKYLIRGIKILGWGMVITLVTYLVLGHGFVVFGILHLIGFSIVAAYPLLPYRRRYLSLLAGAAAIGLGIYLRGQVSVTPWLIWLGIPQIGRAMADYYPVLPWFGVALLGVSSGHLLYPGGLRRLALPDLSSVSVIRGLSFLGRHSLFIYLIHQPILLGILILLGIGSL
jgi:uncharacterized membrane protein